MFPSAFPEPTIKFERPRDGQSLPLANARYKRVMTRVLDLFPTWSQPTFTTFQDRIEKVKSRPGNMLFFQDEVFATGVRSGPESSSFMYAAYRPYNLAYTSDSAAIMIYVCSLAYSSSRSWRFKVNGQVIDPDQQVLLSYNEGCNPKETIHASYDLLSMHQRRTIDALKEFCFYLI